MGMDVYGKNPSSETGEYFRASVWTWRPLWTLACSIGRDLGVIDDKLATAGEYNDGAGLDDAGAQALAVGFQSLLDSGELEDELLQYDMQLDFMPDEVCDLCHGTGKRTDMEVANGCNACHGSGKKRPFATHYRLDLERVKAFAAFLQDCGGFAIN